MDDADAVSGGLLTETTGIADETVRKNQRQLFTTLTDWRCSRRIRMTGDGGVGRVCWTIVRSWRHRTRSWTRLILYPRTSLRLVGAILPFSRSIPG